MILRRSLVALLVLGAVCAAGCGGGGGGSSSTAANTPVNTAVPTQAQTTPTTPKKKAKPKQAKPNKGVTPTPKPAPSNPVSTETSCGKVALGGQFQASYVVSSTGLPCAKASPYAQKFASGDQPSQANLPAGWQISACTGIGDRGQTPGHPNWPRCSHGSQSFTIHLPGG
jgi:hypothetical protein